jgi:hypothetical protein
MAVRIEVSQEIDRPVPVVFNFYADDHIPPTGKEVMMSGNSICCLSGGKIAEGRSNFDRLGMLQQLGVIPPPGQAGA